MKTETADRTVIRSCMIHQRYELKEDGTPNTWLVESLTEADRARVTMLSRLLLRAPLHMDKSENSVPVMLVTLCSLMPILNKEVDHLDATLRGKQALDGCVEESMAHNQKLSESEHLALVLISMLEHVRNTVLAADEIGKEYRGKDGKMPFEILAEHIMLNLWSSRPLIKRLINNYDELEESIATLLSALPEVVKLAEEKQPTTH